MTNPTPQLPLAMATPAWKLPGVLRKVLDVPANHQGIVLMRSGRHRMLPAGRHIVSVMLPRIIWNDTGDWAGYMPESPFAAFYNIPNLLTGDGELVDAGLLCLVKVANPLQFFQDQVMPRREIPANGLEISPFLVQKNLEPLVRRYAADDLSAGLPTEALLGQISDMVEHQVSSMGLALVVIKVFSFIPVSDRAEVANRLAELEDMLSDARMQDSLGGARSQADLDRMMRDLQTSKGIPTGVHPVLAPVAQPTVVQVAAVSAASPAATVPQPAPVAAQGSLAADLKSWLSTGPLGLNAGRFSRLLDLLRQEKPQFVPQAGNVPLGIEKLVNGNRETIDRLVRSQVDRELQHIHEMLQDCRTRAYRGGNEPAALELMRMMRSLEAQRQKIQNTSFGPAAYAGSLNLTGEVLGKYLAYDEGLLVQVANHAEFTHLLQQKLSDGQAVEEDLKVLSSRLETFGHSFSRRARVVELH